MPVISRLSLQAQSYLISFEGTGGSTSVASVEVENLTKGTYLAMNGGDILRLDLTVGIEPIIGNIKDKISFSPNPMKDFSKMQFDLPETGEAIIALYDVSGREIVQTRNMLSKGKHFYCIQGVETGIYFVRISSGKYTLSGRLISSGSQNNPAKIVYENTIALQEKQRDSKGTNAEVVMQYTIGDRLKFIGISGNYSTVMTDIPTSDKTITFNFIACTDASNNKYHVVSIGTQVWMAENLKTTKYSNGDLIGTTTPATLNIHGMTSPKYQWAYDGDEHNVAHNGRLYTWHAVTDSRNVCPAGWHVPTDPEWTTLRNYLIANGYNYDGTITGDKIAKALASTSFWQNDWHTGTVGNTDYPDKRNSTGFTALPGGFRSDLGSFGDIGSYGFWWSASPGYMVNQSWYIYIYYHNNNVGGSIYLKEQGYSVRCVKG
jgi:uncharacterized protein (TIGR02145 family)